MTAVRPTPLPRVLVVSRDGRVSQALAASINVSSRMVAYTATGTPCDLDDAVAASQPDVAIVDVTATDLARDLRLIRRLARRLPVVAVSDSSLLCARAQSAGATVLCEKNGDPEGLAAALASVVSQSARLT